MDRRSRAPLLLLTLTILTVVAAREEKVRLDQLPGIVARCVHVVSARVWNAIELCRVRYLR